MNADESEKGDKGESSGQGNPGTVRAATQPAKRRSATKRARAAAKGGNGGQKGSSERAAPEIVAALKAIQDVVTTPGAADAAIKAIKAIISASPAALGAVKDIAAGAVRAGRTRGVPKRAICLAGGGPAAGLHIGVLQGLKEHGIEFDNEDSVWALSCIGAWVGIVYNQAKEGRGLEETYNFFRDVFRDDESFRSFPTNTIFSPDWFGYADACRIFCWSRRITETHSCRERSWSRWYTPCPGWVIARIGGTSARGISIAGRSITSWQCIRQRAF